MRDLRLAFAATLAVFAASTASAWPHRLEGAGDDMLTAQAQPGLPPCTCRAKGQVFQMGETVCLDTPDGPRLALCAMDQNVSSWRRTPTACPSARAGGRAV
ncbi:MAG: hypothetical protein U1E62_25745 [Alsobacter sp.]